MKRSKYRAVPTVVDGIRFASRAEARRYGELKLLEKSGEISDLTLQPKFPITSDGAKVATYVADFAYDEHYIDSRGGSAWRRVTEDVKSPMTARLPLYRLKKKLVELQYGIEIRETR